MTAINTSSLSSSLTGSSFDWQTFIDQIIEIDSAPITKLKAEQTTNSTKVSALSLLKTNLQELQTATKALKANGLFTGRTVTSSTSGSSWGLSATSGASTGTYTFNVSQLATASKRSGASGISSTLSTSDDVSALTLATLPTSKAPTAGTFTINGATVNVALTDSLQDVFDKISTATGGTVTASYNHLTDQISLSSGSEIVLGGANDSSNFLSVARLANNGTGTISSAGSLGSTSTSSPLASARLRNAITAVDTSGNGSFSVNGVAIAYNVNTDSLSTIIQRINSAGTGVTASYDTASDRMVLVNNATGDTGFGLSESAGGFLDAVGLSMTSSGATTTRGKNALFTVNGGSTLSSTTNNFTSAVTGITGLTVNATTEGTQTISIASDTASMKTAIQNFIDKYNAVQTYIDTQTSITVSNGTVSTSTLSDTREIDFWASKLRSQVFGAVSGLSGTVTRLADLGIDFNGTSNLLTIRDSSKLESALSKNPADVESFFNTTGTGFAAKMDSYLTSLAGTEGTSTGAISTISDRLLKSNQGIDTQIARIQQQLESERSRLMAGFQAMEKAQTNAQAILKTLKNSFSSSSSSSS
ncbi:MAG: flagellar filament capping protein FliD [Nibricoccus sp.]